MEELPEHVQGHEELPGAAAGEERGDGEAGADGGEVVVRVHGAAVGEVGACTVFKGIIVDALKYFPSFTPLSVKEGKFSSPAVRQSTAAPA